MANAFSYAGAARGQIYLPAPQHVASLSASSISSQISVATKTTKSSTSSSASSSASSAATNDSISNDPASGPLRKQNEETPAQKETLVSTVTKLVEGPKKGTLVDGFTKNQEKQLRSRKKSDLNITDADRWRRIYVILFPDDDPATLPSPYYEASDESTRTLDMNDPAGFVLFARREFPQFVRRELEVLFETEYQIIEESVRTRVQDIILALQPRFIELFERVIREPETIDTAIAESYEFHQPITPDGPSCSAPCQTDVT